ncbi:MAG: ABC transporter permease [Acetobacteraceae bacterium]|nr:ABC transporter permease [Acetobacteraceae bacterium]MBV8578451.1 ABC transporter permease [Acetobacteraceae bacterium]
MSPDTPQTANPAPASLSHAAIDHTILEARQHSALQGLLESQAFWVTVALIVICIIMGVLEPASFATLENFFNITRNFSFIGIMALGMVAVIATGGIDLSVGSIMGLVAVVSGLMLQAGNAWWLAVLGGLGAGALAGAINGVLIAYVGISAFVVTLGMLSIARSVAVVLSGNRMIYNFGPDGPIFKSIGNGHVDLARFGDQTLSLSYPLLILVALTIVFAIILKMTAWGRYILAIGGNENAALLTGVPVKRVKVQCYIVSALAAALAAILNVGWSGSAINALGTGYELLAISAAVIGGANLMGGEGSAYGAFIGAALIFVIRNALLMAGVDSNWQGAFVGVFLIAAVYLGKIRAKRG